MDDRNDPLTRLLSLIKVMTFDNIEEVTKSTIDYMERATLKEAVLISDASVERSLELFKEHGLPIPEFKSYKDYISNHRYAKKYGVTVEQIDEWIRDGVISSDFVVNLFDIKPNLKLLKDQSYE